MKKPILIMGIVLFTIFITQDTTQQWWAKFRGRYIPNTCTTLVDRIAPKAPRGWLLQCPGTENLIVTISIPGTQPVDLVLRQQIYKIVANSYVLLAGYSNLETMEQLKNVTVIADHSHIRVISKSDGKGVSTFAGLTKPEDVALQLRRFVRVKEVIK